MQIGDTATPHPACIVISGPSSGRRLFKEAQRKKKRVEEKKLIFVFLVAGTDAIFVTSQARACTEKINTQ
jgi:hypothetical protein